MKQFEIMVTVNGDLYRRTVAAHMTLLQFIREDLNLTGTKDGCSEGECGACTVLLDGKPVNSCLVLAAEVDGRDVLTVEGLAKNGELDPLQQAFMDIGASQCGYCTPGMLLSAKALLSVNPNPTEEDIRTSIEGNLCRCTGYNRIVDAIMLASKRINSESYEIDGI